MSLEAFLGFLADLLKFGAIFYLAVFAVGLIIMVPFIISARRSVQRMKAESAARRKEMDERWRGR